MSPQGLSTRNGAAAVPPAVLAARFAAQLLTGPPAPDPVTVAGRLLAVQAQDPRGARLAIRARTSGLTAADVDRALTEDRSLLITWLNRGTLHLIRSADYWWLHPLVTPPLVTASARRLAQEGVTPDAADDAVAVIERSLTAEGPLTRAQLRARLDAAGLRTAGQVLVHELLLANLRGIAVRGPMTGGEHAYVLVTDWLGPPPAQWAAAWSGGTGAFRAGAGSPGRPGQPGVPAPGPGTRDLPAPEGDWRERALAELARRFLAGHGPASDRDLAKWSGLPLRDARSGLSAIVPELRPRTDDLAELAAVPDPARFAAGQPSGPEQSAGRAERAGRARLAGGGVPPPRLLGSFDPLLHGWVSREPITGDHTGIVTTNGLFRPFALVDGRAAATWALSGSKLTLNRFGALPAATEAALAADAADVLRYLGLPPQDPA
jgi:hypothetical protein